MGSTQQEECSEHHRGTRFSFSLVPQVLEEFADFETKTVGAATGEEGEELEKSSQASGEA